MKTNYFLAGIFFIMISCSGNKPEIDSETYSTFQKKGSEITTLAQATLLSNVGKAIQTGGPEYAVEFCNLKAFSIVDSLSQENQCVISRISVKNRNPENNLKSDQEKKLWAVFESENLMDTLIKANQKLLYYKTITTGMPACLKCHGEPEKDINTATYEKINALYPNDLATGYQLNEFRGLWKIEFDIPSDK
jgi:hypothetical protein